MKKDVHPIYFPAAKIVCACGKTYEVGSTLETIEVELCSACHPFYTGNQKILDTARRVEKFTARATKKEATVRSKATKLKTKAAKRKPKFEVETTRSARITKSSKKAA